MKTKAELDRYRASLDKHHYCPFCDKWWDSDEYDSRAACPNSKCNATAWERLCRIEQIANRENAPLNEAGQA
jgi:hypothetical protein